MSLPQPGDLNWGIGLDDFLQNVVNATAQQALTEVNAHTTETDPHGDRAYGNSLFSEINGGTDGPDGYLKLGSSGFIPTSVFPVGGYRGNVWDVVKDFGAIAGNGADQSSAIQAALTAASNAGGGEVWVPDGSYDLAETLIIGSNTWLHLSPGAILRRTGTQTMMLSNVSFSSSPAATPAQSNVLVSGGSWDSTGDGTLTSACTPIFLCQTFFCAVIQTNFEGVAGNPLIELNGVTYATLRDDVFTGMALSSVSAVPCIRLNSTSTGTTPPGLASAAYNNKTCFGILVEACAMAFSPTNQFPVCGRFLGTDLFAVGVNHSNVVVANCSSGSSSFFTNPPVDGSHITDPHTMGNHFNGGGTLDITTNESVFMGPASASGSPVQVNVAGGINYATGYEGNVTQEDWHYVDDAGEPAFGSGWSNYGHGGASLAFRRVVSPPNTVQVAGEITPAAGAGSTVFTLPAGYILASTQSIEGYDTRGNVPLTALVVGATGVVEIMSPLNAGRPYWISGSFSLDA